jgi:hypothetical protein
MKRNLAALLLVTALFGLAERSYSWAINERNGSFGQWLLALVINVSVFLLGVLE